MTPGILKIMAAARLDAIAAVTRFSNHDVRLKILHFANRAA